MRKVYCGVSGSDQTPVTHRLSEVDAPKQVLDAFVAFYGHDILLRPAQEETLINHRTLSRSDNVIIATATNSGKSLISYLGLFAEAFKGKTVVLIEPLRALAYEKSEELCAIAALMKKQSKVKISITVTTGDYRLSDEFMGSKPAGHTSGQIIVATPERLDAISRISDNKEWFKNISMVCIDEAHLIGDPHRGATIELLIAFLRSANRNIRLMLMSATISNTDELEQWLDPCDIITDIPRYPTLDKWVYCVENEEKPDDILATEIADVLKDNSKSVVVFVYQTASAEALAQHLAAKFSGKRIKKHDLQATMNAGVAWYHARLSAATRHNIVEAMENGTIRVVVSTTALSMGVNLPATHVFVRDISFSGYGDLDIADLMQMLGRAGRGNNPGTGIVLLSKSNLSKETTIVAGITHETVPRVESQLMPAELEGYFGNREDLYYIDRVGNQIMGIINRYGNITISDLHHNLSQTLCGERFDNLPSILRYLSSWKLAYLNEDTNEYELTHLGRIASRCYIPPVTAANAGQLIRDLLSDRSDGAHIAQFTAIDYLIMLCLISAENKPLVRYSNRIKQMVGAYMEALPLDEKSYLYRTWISGAPEELLGSARISALAANAEKTVYQCVYTAILLYDISRGKNQTQLSDYYGFDVEEVQEKLRDNALWILSGIEKILEVRSFYFHLKNNCEAEVEQIHGVEMAFKKASRIIFALIANLKFRSHLGELVRGIKRVYPNAESYPGEGSIKKLEAAGVTSVRGLVGKTATDLTALGIQKKYADLIVGYVRKRMN